MKKLKLLLITVVAPAVLVICLGYVTLRQDKPNGFNRKFLDIAKLKSKAPAPTRVTEIAGTTSEHLYFRTLEPNTVLTSNYTLTKFGYHVLAFETNQDIRNNYMITVDSPSVKIFAGNLSTIITTSLNNEQPAVFQKFATKPISDGLEFEKNRYILRTFDPKEKDYVLTKVDSGGNIIATEQTVSVLKHELGLSTQSNLLYNKNTGRLFIIYRLFNTILSIDTNLKLVYRTHTIDTISTASFSTKKVKEQGRTRGTYSAPPKYTNYRACIDEHNIYVYSRLKADNEPSNHAVIDVYSQFKGVYRYSFTLPETGDSRILDIAIKGTTLIALFEKDKYIQTYSLNNIP